MTSKAQAAKRQVLSRSPQNRFSVLFVSIRENRATVLPLRAQEALPVTHRSSLPPRYHNINTLQATTWQVVTLSPRTAPPQHARRAYETQHMRTCGRRKNWRHTAKQITLCSVRLSHYSSQ